MIQFMRDKDGRLYAVKDGQVIGQVEAFNEAEAEPKRKENEDGKSGRR